MLDDGLKLTLRKAATKQCRRQQSKRQFADVDRTGRCQHRCGLVAIKHAHSVQTPSKVLIRRPAKFVHNIFLRRRRENPMVRHLRQIRSKLRCRTHRLRSVIHHRLRFVQHRPNSGQPSIEPSYLDRQIPRARPDESASSSHRSCSRYVPSDRPRARRMGNTANFKRRLGDEGANQSNPAGHSLFEPTYVLR